LTGSHKFVICGRSAMGASRTGPGSRWAGRAGLGTGRPV